MDFRVFKLSYLLFLRLIRINYNMQYNLALKMRLDVSAFFI